MIKLIILVGLPGSGKSTYAKVIAEQTGARIVSSDAIRAELGDINSQEHNKEVFEIAHKRTRKYLKAGYDVIFDATNMSRKARKAILANAPKDVYKECIVIWESIDTCLQRNKNRERQVPEEVIFRMVKNFHTPSTFEGFNSIIIHYSYAIHPSYEHGYSDYLDMDQENHHHTLTLGEHQLQAAKSIIKYEDDLLYYATLIHDCGKSMTKFYDEKTKECRYFGHENAGAYLALGYEYPEGIYALDVSLLVNLHMEPYHWMHADNPEQTKQKYKEKWGEELFERVIRLHEADRSAH